MVIPFMDLSGCYEDIYDEIIERINKLIQNTSFVGGEEVIFFEKEFAQYCDIPYAISCGNGTDAIVIALKTLNIGPGDTVVTVPNTFIATTEAVSAVGANIAFVDIDDNTYTMDPKRLREYLEENSIKKNIKAVIPVHLYGQMADMQEIQTIANQFGLKIIEDAAQAHGAKYNDYGPGFYGDMATFSFYPGKNLGAFGDGGAIVTKDGDLARRAKMLTNHGRIEKYQHLIEGYNSRLDTIQASVLRIKLKRLDKWNSLRIERAKQYCSYLSESSVILPTSPSNVRHVYHLFVCRVKNRDHVQEKLKQNGIITGIHYPIPLHLQPAYEDLGYKFGSFPVTEKVSKEIISLPLWPEIKEEDVKYISEKLLECLV